MKELTFLGKSLLKALIFAFTIHILGMGKCEFDKNIQRLYIYSNCIFSYHLFYKLFLSKCYTKFQPPGSYDLGSFMQVSTVI